MISLLFVKVGKEDCYKQIKIKQSPLGSTLCQTACKVIQKKQNIKYVAPTALRYLPDFQTELCFSVGEHRTQELNSKDFFLTKWVFLH